MLPEETYHNWAWVLLFSAMLYATPSRLLTRRTSRFLLSSKTEALGDSSTPRLKTRARFSMSVASRFFGRWETRPVRVFSLLAPPHRFLTRPSHTAALARSRTEFAEAMRMVLTEDAHKDVPFAAFYFNTVDGERLAELLPHTVVSEVIIAQLLPRPDERPNRIKPRKLEFASPVLWRSRSAYPRDIPRFRHERCICSIRLRCAQPRLY